MRINMAIINAVIMTNIIIIIMTKVIVMTFTMACIVLVRELRQHGSGHSQHIPLLPLLVSPRSPCPIPSTAPISTSAYTSPSLASFLFPIAPCL